MGNQFAITDRLHKLFPERHLDLEEESPTGFTIAVTGHETSFEDLKKISEEFHTTDINLGSDYEVEGGYSDETPSYVTSRHLIIVRGAT